MLKSKISQRAVAAVLGLALLGGAVAALAQGSVLDTFTGKYYKGKFTGKAGESTLNLFVSKTKENQVKIGSNNTDVLADACVSVAVQGSKIVQSGDPVFITGGCGIRGAGRGAAPTAGLKLTIDTAASPVTMSYTPAEGSTFTGTLVPMN